MTTKPDDVLATAKKRYEYGLEKSSHNREAAKRDIRFAAASPDDPWQWDESQLQARQGRPTLTINKMPQHIRQVTNDIRQNRPAIKFRPADSKADPEVANILMGVVRHIESNSDAEAAYDTAYDNQVIHGTGYVRVLTDYVSDASFDQDIFIRAIPKPLECVDDPDALDFAGADRRFFFIPEELTEDEFKAQYPDAEPVEWDFDPELSPNWFSSAEKKIRVAEYFELCTREKTLILWDNGATSYEGDQPPQGALAPAVGKDGKPKKRKAQQPYVMWRKITGKEVLEEREFPCKWIPIARFWGNVAFIEGKTYVSGIVRNAKDSQRMYNVAQSAIVERVMQAPKAPYVGYAEFFAGYDKVWRTANTGNHAFLAGNLKDDEGNVIPLPQRTTPATVETGLQQVAMGAADDIKSETGQYDASLGQRSNETSGKAIMARQREGDTSTYHYTDNGARGVKHLGRIILDMIPRVLDTRRVARILGEEGDVASATIEPDMPQPFAKVPRDDGKFENLFNPAIGTYDVYVTTGPSFTTRRQEAVEAMSQMTQANPQLWQVIGDQLVKNMDWPGAEEMAERLKAVLLPEVRQADEEGAQVPPEVQQAMDQMSAQMQEMQAALQDAGRMVEELKGDKDKLQIDAYAKITDRLKIVAPLMAPQALEVVMRDILQQATQQPDPLPDDMPVMRMEPQPMPQGMPMQGEQMPMQQGMQPAMGM
jgi:hypothetical protein